MSFTTSQDFCRYIYQIHIQASLKANKKKLKEHNYSVVVVVLVNMVAILGITRNSFVKLFYIALFLCPDYQSL